MERAGVSGLDSAQIWSISDGRAGNARQADALAGALADALGGTARVLALAPRAPWRWFAPRTLPAADRAFGDAFAAALAAPPTLAIGCGRQAGLATRLLHERGAKSVQILDPRIDPSHWDLVIAPEHDGLSGGNILTLLGSLNPVDDAWLDRARLEFAPFADLPAPRTALLVGGPMRHARFDAARFESVCGQLGRQVAQEGGCVLATTSRRTPPAIAGMLRQRLADTPGLAWCGADDGPNPYAGLLAWADRIVCSPDSINMISEACATRTAVEVFDIEHTSGRQRRFLDALLALGRIQPFGVGRPSASASPLRETRRIADAIRARLGLARASIGTG
ncbi:MAG TPA: mitochondrial fission ELM1 family protein [Luteimonas sp.]|nr:mitochondrial fission ELM1 family protein [Luteimonas sp.]HRO27079.1 mitochondrial fission ELM1 family protein [Luteimonas sp.]HRP72307.1 mitochondrial fission ELM1 family protein [Luteimonas sp.]